MKQIIKNIFNALHMVKKKLQINSEIYHFTASKYWFVSSIYTVRKRSLLFRLNSIENLLITYEQIK